MENITEVVKFCCDRKALRFGNFTLKGGRKSPVFFNIFLTINDGAGLAFMGKQYTELILEFLSDVVLKGEKNPDKLAQLQSKVFLFGPAYKGIPLAAITADYLFKEKNLSFRWGYDRKEAKTHGEKGGADNPEALLDGDVRDGDLVVILDDVLTEGTAKMEGIEKVTAFAAAKKVKVTIAGIATFLDRWEGGHDLRKQFPVRACIRMDEVAKNAFEQKLISREDFDHYTSYFQEFGLK
ncbi:MAG: orotate phosphoribosyltransferase [Promethearchaeota archaeon CR_4]|nr:MAG: orotate phosphoribosyltransferase [Candidatus Lokiarchaeota archaeon CR_4]